MFDNIDGSTHGNAGSDSLTREVEALRFAVQQLSDLLFMNVVADPAIEHPESRVQYASQFLAKLSPAAPVLHAMSRMLAMEDAGSTPDECFDSDRMTVRLACREAAALAVALH